MLSLPYMLVDLLKVSEPRRHIRVLFTDCRSRVRQAIAGRATLLILDWGQTRCCYRAHLPERRHVIRYRLHIRFQRRLQHGALIVELVGR